MSNWICLNDEPADNMKATEWKTEEGEQDTPFGTAKLYYSKFNSYYQYEVDDSTAELYKQWGYVTDETGMYKPTELEMAVIDIGEYQAVIRYDRTDGAGEYTGKIKDILTELFTLE